MAFFVLFTATAVLAMAGSPGTAIRTDQDEK
jgi:hypothetical protein